MAHQFPSPEWLAALNEKLNSDSKYAKLAQKWEGDITIIIQPSGPLKDQLIYYLDLWHGTCRKTAILADVSEVKAAFVLKSPYDNMVKILLGKLDPMQAMMTRKLLVQGNMAMMMRSVPVVLDFVRCAREVTSEVLS